jgi:adenylosuccinate synthase
MEDQVNRTGHRISDMSKYCKFPFIITNTVQLLESYRKQGSSILFEGAQGFGLDLWHGTYPYVTSSFCTAGAVSTNAGFSLQHIDEIVGVLKCYTTRVGNGPFASERHDSWADIVTDRGKEYGATTGRKRRVGAINIDELKQACLVNKPTCLALMKVDVLTGLEIPVFMNGKEIKKETWSYSVKEGTEYPDLHENLRQFVLFLEDQLDTPVKYISYAPEGPIYRKRF